MAIDRISENIGSASVSIIAENKFHALSTSLALTYGSDWVFDSSTIISVCSNYDGSPGVGCIVQNLKLMYIVPLQITTMPFSNTSKPLKNNRFFIISRFVNWRL